MSVWKGGLWQSQRGGTQLAVKLSFPTDTDGNGVLTDDEVGANIVARVALPKVAKVGDVITVTDGTTPADITLTQTDLDAGYVESAFAWPAGNLFSGNAWITHTADPVPGEIGLMVAPAIASGSYDDTSGEIVLDLTDDSTGDPDYREVYRDTSPMDPQNLPVPHATNLPARQTQFREAVAEDGTTYYYRTANVAGSKKRVSGEVSVAANAASLAQPTGLTVVDDPAGPSLTWTSNSSGHDGTTIHRSTATMDPQALPAPIGIVAAGTTEYIDGETLADGTYYYRVQDYQGASVSAASDETSFAVSGSEAHLRWRIVINATHGSDYATLAEVQMRATSSGVDQCEGGLATASSVYQTQSPSLAFDDDQATHWLSETTPTPHWVAYEFASASSVTEVVLQMRDTSTNLDQAPRDFDVQFSDDGTTWTTAWSVTSEPAWSALEARTYTKPVS